MTAYFLFNALGMKVSCLFKEASLMHMLSENLEAVF